MADRSRAGIEMNFSFGKGRFGSGVCRLIGGRVDLIERLTGFHIRSLREETFLNDTAHLGPYFRDKEG